MMNATQWIDYARLAAYNHILLIIRQLTNIQIKTCALNRRIRSRAQVEVEDLEKTKCLILIKQTKDARITDKAQGIDVFYMGI